jgi:hypothetical protein
MIKDDECVISGYEEGNFNDQDGIFCFEGVNKG